MLHPPPGSSLCPYTTLFRSLKVRDPKFVEQIDDWYADQADKQANVRRTTHDARPPMFTPFRLRDLLLTNRVVVSDRKSTRLNSSHANSSYAVFCLKQKLNHT